MFPINVLKNPIKSKTIDIIGFVAPHVPQTCWLIAEVNILPTKVITINNSADITHPITNPIPALPTNCRPERFPGSLKIFLVFSGFAQKFIGLGIV